MENKHTQEDLKTMQGWDLQRKIQVTQLRIMEWYEHYKGQVYVSFSGGKDSTVLLDLARRIYPNIEAVFVDTGLEYPEIRDFVKTKDNVTWLKPKMRFDEVVKRYGYPIFTKSISRQINDIQSSKNGEYCWANRCFDGREKGKYNMQKYKYLLTAPFKISNKCCDKTKKEPLYKYNKEFRKSGIVGTMACESNNRFSAFIKNGCNSFKSKPISNPMAFWTEQDVLQYIKQFEIPYCSIYGDITEEWTKYKRKENKPTGKLILTGAQRTGCMFCMFGCHLEKEPNRFQRMKITHPKQYDYCIRPIEQGGLGLGEVLDFIGVKY